MIQYSITKQILQKMYIFYFISPESLQNKIIPSSSTIINLIQHCMGVYNLRCLSSDIKRP